MQITESIISRISGISGRPAVVGVCGRAGGGKSTLAQKIKEELSGRGIESISYSGDWRFKLDSEGRKVLMREKWLSGLDEYLRAVNQFNWWDFEKIYADLNLLKTGSSVFLENAYNRETGQKNLHKEVRGIKSGVIFYENCILGGVDVLDNLDIVILLNTPDNVCFGRLAEKDSKRRTFPDIIARQLITLYSENLFFKSVLEKFPKKLLVCNSEGIIGEFPTISEASQIPVPIGYQKNTSAAKGVIFCDLDGTLVKHVPVPSETGDDIEIIEGSSEKIREFKEKGYYLILTTSRPYHKIFGIINKLKLQGLEFDQIISDLPVGLRHLINDSKGDEVRAIVHPLKRDEGIKNIIID
jgi:uridine kinase